MKFGFIGCGNMGGSILRGFIKNNICSCNEVFVFDKNETQLNCIKNELKVNTCSNYTELISQVEYVVLAVKPNVFPILLKELSPLIKKYNSKIISIAAGLSILKIEQMLNLNTTPIVRVMPNINATIGMSTSGYCYNSFVSSNDLENIKKAFNSIGSLFFIEEDKFSIFSAIASCSPAFVYLFIDSLAKGATKAGLSKKDALQIVTNTIIGSSEMFLKSKKHPHELIDMVCSPGGTTIEGICTLEDNNFQQTIVKAIDKAIDKDKKLNS